MDWQIFRAGAPHAKNTTPFRVSPSSVVMLRAVTAFRTAVVKVSQPCFE